MLAPDLPPQKLPPQPPAQAEPWSGEYLTTADLFKTLVRQTDLRFQAGEAAAGTTKIAIDPSSTFQELTAGFGVAMTDTSAWLLQTKLSADRRQQVLDALFSPTKGIGLSFLRVPIAGSDYIVGGKSYSYADLPAGQTDPTLAQFSTAHDDAYIYPIIKATLAENPQMTVMANPWSPPAWMKTDGQFVSYGLRAPFCRSITAPTRCTWCGRCRTTRRTASPSTTSGPERALHAAAGRLWHPEQLLHRRRRGPPDQRQRRGRRSRPPASLPASSPGTTVTSNPKPSSRWPWPLPAKTSPASPATATSATPPACSWKATSTRQGVPGNRVRQQAVQH